MGQGLFSIGASQSVLYKRTSDFTTDILNELHKITILNKTSDFTITIVNGASQ